MQHYNILAIAGFVALSFSMQIQAAAPEGLNCPRGSVEKVNTHTGKLECQKLGLSAGTQSQRNKPSGLSCQRGWIEKKDPKTGKMQCEKLKFSNGKNEPTPLMPGHVKMGDIDGE